MSIKKYNYKQLSNKSGLNYNIFLREVQICLSDPNISEQFGNYRRKILTRRQLKILIENISFIEHLKTDPDFIDLFTDKTNIYN